MRCGAGARRADAARAGGRVALGDRAVGRGGLAAGGARRGRSSWVGDRGAYAVRESDSVGAACAVLGARGTRLRSWRRGEGHVDGRSNRCLSRAGGAGTGTGAGAGMRGSCSVAGRRRRSDDVGGRAGGGDASLRRDQAEPGRVVGRASALADRGAAGLEAGDCLCVGGSESVSDGRRCGASGYSYRLGAGLGRCGGDIVGAAGTGRTRLRRGPAASTGECVASRAGAGRKRLRGRAAGAGKGVAGGASTSRYGLRRRPGRRCA